MDIKGQRELLDLSVSSGQNLCDILSRKGLSYDDLRYIQDIGDDKDIFNQDKEAENFVDWNCINIPTNQIPAVSFFSGAGGLDIGFKYAGFNNIISIEHTKLFCDTLRYNDHDKEVIGPPFYEGDLSKRETISQCLKNLGVNENFNGVFHGGPPCQSFSIAANQRFNKTSDGFKRIGFNDVEKGMLLFDYIWYIKTFKPLAFLIENVEGITEFGIEKITNALNELREMGYCIQEPKVLDAAYYGVPQHRKRWIVLGIRGNKPINYPEPSSTPMPCGWVFQKSIDNISNHETRMHKAESIQRYMLLAPGGRDKLGRVDRLDPRKPAKTVIAGGVKGGGRSHLHPFIPRTISVRECARLQTFPDNYVFTGTTARQFTQVGNAVPPKLAYQLAMKIREAINNL